MSEVSKEEIIDVLIPRLEILGLSKSDVDTDQSLLEQGILDSMSFLEFIVDLETKFGVELDFSNLDPSEFTSVDKLQNVINDEIEN